MKFIKILLIIALLTVMCSGISYGDGTITSGDKTIYLCPEPEEKSILNEWFENLPIMEKMKLYTYWHGLNNYRSEFDDRLIWLEERVKKLEQYSVGFHRVNHWQQLKIDANEEWLKQIREVMGDELPEAISQKRGENR